MNMCCGDRRWIMSGGSSCLKVFGWGNLLCDMHHESWLPNFISSDPSTSMSVLGYILQKPWACWNTHKLRGIITLCLAQTQFRITSIDLSYQSFVLLSLFSLGCCPSEWPSKRISEFSEFHALAPSVPQFTPGFNNISFPKKRGEWCFFRWDLIWSHLQDILGSLLMWKLLVCASLSLQVRMVRGALLARILKPLMK